MATLVNAGQMSKETGVKTMAAANFVNDVEAELNAIDQDAP